MHSHPLIPRASLFIQRRRTVWRYRPHVETLEDRTVPSTLVQIADVDGYVADANVDGVFDTVNTTGTSLQTTLIPSTAPATDQSNTPTPWTNYNTSAGTNLPLGQEFRPTASSLGYVDLRIADAGSDIGPGANFQVRIRSGTITGAVVATSVTTFVADGTNTGGGSTYTRFNFSSAVPLTPGATYVIEIVQLTTGTPGVANFMMTADQSGTDTYTNGRAIIRGAASTDGVDFLFRTGTPGQPGVTERAVMEFNTAPIVAGSVINAVSLTGTINTLQPLVTGGVTAVFHLYTGNGQITTADATAYSGIYTQLVNPGLGQFQVDFSPSAVQSLIQSAGYNGYLGAFVQLASGQRIYLDSTESTAASTKPTLTIVYDTDNLIPTAANDSYVLNEGQTQLVVSAPGVLGNDTDPDSDPLTAAVVTNPRLGSLALAADGSFVYTRYTGVSGTSDSFTYRATDGSLTSNLATVTIRFNRPPVAFNRTLTATMNTTLNVAAPGILANNYDPDFDPLTALLVSGPSHGQLTLNANGSLTYIPDPDYIGGDSFTYQVSDGQLTSNTATVSVLVNALPVAQNDGYSVDQDTVLSVASPGVLGNDSDLNGQTLVASLLSTTSHGALTLNGNGSFQYTPSAGYHGGDSFTYRVWDGYSYSSAATVSLTVNRVNHAPVAANDAYSVDEDQTLTVSPLGGTTTLVMHSQAGDYIGQGRDYSFSSLTGTFSASRNFDNGVSIYYQHTLNSAVWWYLDFAAPNNATLMPGTYLGATRFPFQAATEPGLSVSGEGRGSNTLTGQFTVTQAVYGAGGQVLRFDATFEQHSEGATPALTGEIHYVSPNAPASVLNNDSDTDGDPLTAVLVSNPANGSVTLNPDGTFSYTPNANFHGPDTFTYKASDGSLDSNVATVTITVNPVNDAPVASGNSYTTAEDTPLIVPAAGVLANDSDVDGNPLTASLVSGPSHGSLALNANGSFTYTPAANYHGGDSFTYRASDGTASSTATVSLTITAVNDPPVANAGPDQTASEGAAVSFTGSASSDLDGDTLTYSWDFGDGGGGSGAAPSHAFADNGVYTVTLTVNDGNGGSASDTMEVSVSNALPTATVTGPSSGVRGQPRTFRFGASDASSVDQGSAFSFSIAWGDGATQIVGGPVDQHVEHTYTANGTYTVRVTATDKDGGVSAVAEHAMTIRAVDVQGAALAVGGTLGGDNIVIKPANSAGDLRVTIGGVDQGVFAPPAQLLVYGQAGNDSIVIAKAKIGRTTYTPAVAAVLFGGDGDDTLDARDNTRNSILVGGSGVDALKGGSGRDILIGGLGADNVQGNGGDDIVIGGVTRFDANLNALLALMAEWGRTDVDDATRVNHLNGTTPDGRNGDYLLNSMTVLDDAAIDRIYGQDGWNWFFAKTGGSNKDKIMDLGGDELVTPL